MGKVLPNRTKAFWPHWMLYPQHTIKSYHSHSFIPILIRSSTTITWGDIIKHHPPLILFQNPSNQVKPYLVSLSLSLVSFFPLFPLFLSNSCSVKKPNTESISVTPTTWDTWIVGPSLIKAQDQPPPSQSPKAIRSDARTRFVIKSPSGPHHCLISKIKPLWWLTLQTV